MENMQEAIRFSTLAAQNYADGQFQMVHCNEGKGLETKTLESAFYW